MEVVNRLARDDEFMKELASFLATDDFQTAFEQFFQENSVEFHFAGCDSEEQSIRQFQIYTEFRELFDQKLLVFCKEHELTTEEFYSKCRDCQTSDNMAAKYLEVMLVSTEYESFARLMRYIYRTSGAQGAKKTSHDDIDAKGGDSKEVYSSEEKDSSTHLKSDAKHSVEYK